MGWFLAAFGLVAHVYFWGAAAAVLLLPRRFERLWPWFAPLAGLAVQSAVVWFGARLPVAGTDAYGLAAPALPAGLTAFVLWRRRGPGLARLVGAAAGALPLAVAQAAVLAWLLLPLVQSPHALTTVSAGSADAADYAAGLRVFKEFAPDDRGGYLGHEEAVTIGAVRDLRTYFLRLNHFTPSALMALNASVLVFRPHEIVSVFTAVLPALLMPGVFLAGRMVLRFRAPGAMALAVTAGAGPLVAYAVFHVAPAQILATAGVVALTWAGVAAFERSRDWRGLLSWSGAAFAALWILAGAYNFILLVAPVPAVAWVSWRAVAERRLGAGLRWLVWASGVLVAVVVVFPGRFAGLVERFRLLEQYDFGWPVPGLRPDGWLGAVADHLLHPASGAWLWAGGALLAGSILHLARARAWRGRAGLALVALAGPAACGYALLLGEAALKGNNASYDAYKLLSVFLPLVIGALCPWLGVRRRDPAWTRALAGALALLLVVVAFAGSARFHPVMRAPPLFVRPTMASLVSAERIPGEDGVNLRVGGFWARLWANAFLLRSRQYFPTHTYEARRPTELRGTYDLLDGLVRLRGPGGAGPVFESAHYALVDRRAPWFLEVGFGPGWYDPETHGDSMWRWSSGAPRLSLHNPATTPRRVRVLLELRAATSVEARLMFEEGEVWRGRVDPERRQYEAGVLTLPPGISTLVIEAIDAAPVAVGPDPRPLFVALFGITLEVVDASP